MTERSSLFQLDAEAARQPMHAPQLIVSLEGFMDAGMVSEQMADHLLDALEHQVVATFDLDRLLDYRGRRPVMTFDSDHWSNYEAPKLLLHRLQDHAGQDFLLLHGAEPDYQWEAFVEAVHQLCLAFGVRRMATAHGVPMAVPHTRPVGMTRFGSDPEVVGPQEAVFGRVQVPASVEALLHLRLGEAGVETFGVAVHVPHYLAQARFGDAAVAALDTLLVQSGLQVPTADLVEAAALNRVDITKEVAGSPEVTEVVEALEQRYDRFLDGQRRRSLLAAEAADLPSADEIGAEFEEFLRETTGSETDGPEDATG